MYTTPKMVTVTKQIINNIKSMHVVLSNRQVSVDISARVAVANGL